MIASSPKMRPAPRLGDTIAPEVLRLLEGMERRELADKNGINVAERELLEWLQFGTIPAPITTEPDYLREALDPEEGGFSIEDLNTEARAWWLSVKALQDHLRAFVELEIPEPQQLTVASAAEIIGRASA